MSELAADLLVLWAVATVGCALLLVLVVGLQDAATRARRRRSVRR